MLTKSFWLSARILLLAFILQIKSTNRIWIRGLTRKTGITENDNQQVPTLTISWDVQLRLHDWRWWKCAWIQQTVKNYIIAYCPLLQNEEINFEPKMNSLTQYMGVGMFFSVKFAPYSLCSQGDKQRTNQS